MDDNKLTISNGDLWDFLQKTISEKTFAPRTSRADKLESVAELLIQSYISDNLSFVKKILRHKSDQHKITQAYMVSISIRYSLHIN